MKRIVKNKAETIDCEICKNEISLYGMVNHIRFKHCEISLEEYVKRFGEFRKNKEERKRRKISKIECEISGCNKICSIVGMHNHLRDSHHGLTPDQYVTLGYSEYRPTKLNELKVKERSIGDFNCKICGFECRGEKHLSTHVLKVHEIKKIDYVKSAILNNQIPKCKCGCGNEVGLLSYQPYYREFLSGHNSKGELNPMFGRTHSEMTMIKMSDSAIKRGVSDNKKNTNIEIKFQQFLNDNNILYKTQYPTDFGIVDFYLPDFNILIEIDGSYWHPVNCEKIPLNNIANILSDIKKSALPNLIRIRDFNVNDIQEITDLQSLNFKYNYTINKDTIIFDLDQLCFYLENKSTSSVKEKIRIISKLIIEILNINNITIFQNNLNQKQINEIIGNFILHIHQNKINFTLYNLIEFNNVHPNKK